MDKISKVEEKIKVYEKELSSVISQLAVKRTELSSLAKKTVEHFETSIPKLKFEYDKNRLELDTLNNTISKKRIEAEKQEKSCIDKYNKLEDDLKNSFIIKDSELNNQVRLYLLKNKELINKTNDLINRENIFVKKQSDFNEYILNTNRLLEEERLNFENNKKSILNKILLDEKRTKELLLDIENKDKEISSKLDDLNNKIKILDTKISQADITINRISEVEVILNTAKDKEISNNKRSEELNRMAVKIVVDNQEINKKRRDLANLEKSLLDRESNIKIAEKRIQESLT